MDLEAEALRLAQIQCGGDDCNATHGEQIHEILVALQKAQEAALREDICRCGHYQASHDGHTYAVGGEPPDFCSQHCGCHHFISRRGFDEGRIAGLEEALAHQVDLGRYDHWLT